MIVYLWRGINMCKLTGKRRERNKIFLFEDRWNFLPLKLFVLNTVPNIMCENVVFNWMYNVLQIDRKN